MKKNNIQKNTPVTVEVLDLRLGDMMKLMDGRFDMLIASMNANFKDVRSDMVRLEERLNKKIETEVGGLAIITGRSFKHVEKEIRDIQSRFPLESMV